MTAQMPMSIERIQAKLEYTNAGMSSVLRQIVTKANEIKTLKNLGQWSKTKYNKVGIRFGFESIFGYFRTVGLKLSSEKCKK